MGLANRFRGIVIVGLFLSVASAAMAKYSGGTGEPNDPYQIAMAADLITLGETPGDYDKHFILTADIDLDPNLPGRKVFDKAVIAPDVNDTEHSFQGTLFSGVFDGNGHTISHLTIQGKDHLGLFGQLGPGVEVRNVGVVDVNIVGSGDSVGGLVGWNESASVIACYSTGAVSATGRQAEYVGGLIGSSWGGTVAQCYSTGAPTGRTNVGGLVGFNHFRSEVTACFWDTQTSAQPWSAAGAGKTTAEMQTVKTFLDAGWDFVGETANGTDDIWWILEGKDYPRLWWEPIEVSLNR